MRTQWRSRLGSIRATVFKAASIERFKDAECLHSRGRFEGAIYLCGYALECRLKFSICAVRNRNHLEEREAKELGHELMRLLDATKLRDRLASNDDLFVALHSINTRWSTEIRYSGTAGTVRESERFLRDTRALCQWLEEVSRP